MSNNFYLGRRVLIGGLLALALIGGSGSIAKANAVEESSPYLGNLHKDEVAGIIIAPPTGAKVFERAELSLMSFVHEEKQWGGSVMSVMLKEKMNISKYMTQSVVKLSETFRGVRVVSSNELKFQKFDAGRLTTTLEAEVSAVGGGKGGAKEKIALFRQDLIVQQGENQFMLLTMSTPVKDRAEAEQTFEAMIKTFVILNKDEVGKKRWAAMQEGKKWLAKRSADELKGKLIAVPQVFRIKLAGVRGGGSSDVGFLRFDEMEKDQQEGKGVMVVVSTRTWLDEESVQNANIAFWRYTNDGRAVRQGYSSWENRNASLKYGKEYPGGKYEFWVTEYGKLIEEANTRLDAATIEMLKKEREALLQRRDIPANQIPPAIEPIQKVNRLQVSYAGDRMQDFTNNNKGIDRGIPDMEFRPAVLPKILEYTWPRVVDLTKPSEMMFVVYNSAASQLTYRFLAVVGPTVIKLDGQNVNCFKCTDETDGKGWTYWVDANGKILKGLSTDQATIEPTTQAEMERLWGRRKEYGTWPKTR